MSAAIESKMKSSLLQLEEQLAERMGKQFAKMWDKAIDTFQEQLREQNDQISQRSRSEGRSRSPSEVSRKGLLAVGSRARSTSQSKGAVIASNDFGALSGAIDLSNQNKFVQSSSAKPLFGGAGAEAAARNTASAKTNQGLDHQDDASMRSKSPISSKSNLDARKSGISQEADKG